MAPRKTPSDEAEPETAEATSETLEDQREADLEAATQSAGAKADVSVESRSQAYAPPGYYPDNYTDGAVNYGTFCVVGGDGPEAGLYGVYIDNVSADDTGKPEVVLVRERNSGRVVSVNYDDLEPAQPGDIGRGR
jgi:hypothetical protein